MLMFQTPLDVPAGEHKLQYEYCLWFSRRSPGKQASVQNYDQNLKLIGRFASVEQFWALYSHLVRPSDLQSHSDFHLFKAGIKPMWEVSFMLPIFCLLYWKLHVGFIKLIVYVICIIKSCDNFMPSHLASELKLV
jgi:hypothetical protein